MRCIASVFLVNHFQSALSKNSTTLGDLNSTAQTSSQPTQSLVRISKQPTRKNGMLSFLLHAMLLFITRLSELYSRGQAMCGQSCMSSRWARSHPAVYSSQDKVQGCSKYMPCIGRGNVSATKRCMFFDGLCGCDRRCCGVSLMRRLNQTQSTSWDKILLSAPRASNVRSLVSPSGCCLMFCRGSDSAHLQLSHGLLRIEATVLDDAHGNVNH